MVVVLVVAVASHPDLQVVSWWSLGVMPVSSADAEDQTAWHCGVRAFGLRV